MKIMRTVFVFTILYTYQNDTEDEYLLESVIDVSSML